MGESPPALGYLAPIGAGILVISVWLVIGLRYRHYRRNQRNSHFLDLESIPFRRGHSVISSGDVDKQFPQMKYSDWWAGQSRKGSIAKETIGSLGSVSKDAKGNETDILAPEAHAQKTDSTENTQSDKAQEHFCDSGNACEHGSDDAASESGCLCAICMDSIEGETYIRPLTCGHIFHSSCVDPWLTRRRASCPLCNKSFGDHGARDTEETDAPPFPFLAVPRAAMIRSDVFPRTI
ncbi:hypothetical protein BDV32DRAFT_35763 [Aspergillus pseudonomiae]|uniref:RING-type E3 ubiquitin transferase n=1 Tax=Aspergillus pseudonomiae TaxID=1506151 RepID=A0A5N6IHK1_9EURO|nr:uncharacterized protein BDV37DRAFT_256041 [Aspergillus pseudonomiae]KAB8265806.1 hypothetical protein BDV32DRAFT_35763 [Aspergillus pseudonomiae]KAE8401046.1 hypothetical protein BDV37DRAFT_256041 [Aspergillus pseudonomiae]